MRQLYSIDEFSLVFCDGLVTKQSELIFGSFWGRDTAILEFLSRFQVSPANGGMSSICVAGVNALVKEADLQKFTGRVTNEIFGKLVHLWLYNPKVIAHRDAHGESLTLIDQVTRLNQVPRSYLWPLVKAVAPFPMLDAWEHQVIEFLLDADAISLLPGLNLSCIEVSINEEALETFLSEGVRDNLLDCGGLS